MFFLLGYRDRVALSCILFTFYSIKTPFNTFANRADPDQAALLRATGSGSTLFAYENMIRIDPTLVDLTSTFFVLCTNVKVDLYT